MEFSGLSVIEDRNLVLSAVGYANLGNGFLCTLCILENSAPRHGRRWNKNPGPCAFGRVTESTESHERPLGLRNRRQFFFID